MSLFYIEAFLQIEREKYMKNKYNRRPKEMTTAALIILPSCFPMMQVSLLDNSKQ